ncbi:uncharacterized protein LOC117515929 [Thalassophryne amazonica]|uniref:uncharacterized protein LOC117515929 n=1 Tax=Thalassophryne amazonica TaxID=390379 RepID=UPI00147252CE|nr:uncharacterized protein LOC117515929 [Thalassophryne amazonica]
MRLTTLCVTLLVISHVSWTTADSSEEVLLWNKDFGPCAVTLIPEGPCRQEQDENTCPYIFNLPPLTLHLPKHLRELEKIVQDVENLKDKVDELRKMCADCTVSQSERECGREREHEKLNEGKDNHNDMRNCRNNTNPNGPKDSQSEFGTDRVKVEGTVEGQGDTDSEKKHHLEEKDRKKAERESNIRIIKKGTLKVVHKKDVKTQQKIEGRQGNDKFGQAKVSGFGQNHTIDINSEKVLKNNSKIVLAVKGNSEGNGEDLLENGEDANTRDVKNNEKLDESSHNIWRAGTKDKEKQTQGEEDRVIDRIKMSEDHGEDTNEEQEQHREEREKEMEQEIQTERHNKKPKDTESITSSETEKTIKKGEVGEKGKEIKTTVQAVQQDGDGELASGKVTQKKDVVSLRPNPHSGPDSTELDRPQTFTSLSKTITQFNTEVNQGMEINEYGFTTDNVGLGYGKTGIPEHLNTGEDSVFRTTTTTTKLLISPFVSLRKNVRSGVTSSPSLRLEPDYQGPESLATSTETTTANSKIYGTMFPQITGFIRWSATKTISTNMKQPKPGDKLNPEIKPKVLQKQNSEYDPKRNRPPLPDRRPAPAQKQKPSHQKPITGQKNTKSSKNVQNPKANQRPLTQNLNHNKTLKYDGEDEQTQIKIQKPKVYQTSMSPTQKQILQYKPGTVNTNSSDISPASDQEPKYAGINQSSKSEQKPPHPLDTHNPEQQQKLDKKTNEGKSTFGQGLISNQTSPSVQEPGPVTAASFTPKPDLNPITEFMKIVDQTFSAKENPKFGPKLKPVRGNIPPEHRPKPNQKISKINQKAKLPQINVTDPDAAQSTKHNQTHPQPVQPDQAPQTNLKPKMPDQKNNFNIKSVRNQEPEAESVKKYKPKPPPRNKIPVRPKLELPVTPLQTPKPVMQPKKTQKTKTLDPLQTTGITPDSIQNSDRDTSSTSSPVTKSAKVNNSQVDRDFSPSTMKTVTMGQETLNSLLVGPPTHSHPVQELATSPNSRITSDLKPQTADQPPSILMTLSPSKFGDEMLPHIIPKTSLGTSNYNQATDSDSRLEENIVLKVEETTNWDTATSSILPSRLQSSSTVSSDFRSSTPVISDFEATAATPLPQESTPSPRELRVKISQLAASFNNSQNPNGGLPDSHPKEHPKDNKGGSQPDGTRRKLSTLIPSKVNKERRDCSDHLIRGEKKSGVYQVTPHLGSRSFTVVCDMELHGGGWTVLQRRQDGSMSFNRTWEEYRSGFGELNGGEFWLGNHLIHLLTRDRNMMLRVELEDFDGVTGYAEYEHFSVANERTHFRLTVGGYSGTAGDALRFSKRYNHNNRAFTTPDKDHDRYPSGNCGAYYSSGWWFDACMSANLNGKYYVGRYKGIRDGIFWGTWQNITKEYYLTNDRQSFKSVRMIIRPKGFAP